MRNLLLSTFVLSSVLVATEARAWPLGIGLMYGTEIQQPGVHVNAYFPVSDQVRVGPEVGLYLPDSQEAFGVESSLTYFDVNGNVQFLFFNDEAILGYGFGGVNILFANASVTSGGTTVSSSDSTYGINVGAGGEIEVAGGSIYGEARLTLYLEEGVDEQLVFGAGYRIALAE